MNVIEATQKISEQLAKLTGSGSTEFEGKPWDSLSYEHPIGEFFGLPIWVKDDYVGGDIPELNLFEAMSHLQIGIDFKMEKNACFVCLGITFSIPLVEYPTIWVCVKRPDCPKEETPAENRTCIPIEEWREMVKDPNLDRSKLKKPCPPPEPELPEGVDETGVTRPEGIEFRVKFAPNVPGSQWSSWSFRAFGELLFGNSNYPCPYAPESGYDIGSSHSDPVPFGCRYGFSYNSYQPNRYCGSTKVDYWSCEGEGSGGIYVVDNALLEFRDVEGNPIYPSTNTPRNENPIPIPDPQPMRDCCDDIKKILARMEKKIDQCKRVINPEQFERKQCTIPKSWIYPTNQNGNEVLKDYPDYLGAIARLVDRKIGFLPQIVNVKDANPAKEGDQPVKIVVNSIADLSKLTLEYLVMAQGNIGAIQLMQVSTMNEAGLAHQLGAVNERMLKAICEFLDFDSYEKTEMLPMAFNPGVIPKNGDDLQKTLAKAIRPHKQPIESYYWSGGESLKDMVMDIRKKVAYAAASATETRDPDKVIEEHLQLQRLLRLLQVREIDERLGVGDLKNFFDESEKGFPESNLDRSFKEKPYGFKPTNKPSFKKTTKGSKKTRYKKIRPPKEKK